MITTYRYFLILLLSLHSQSIGRANEPDSPKPIPQSRKSMLEALEKLKSRTPRLPLPESQATQNDTAVNDRPGITITSAPRSLGVVNNGRMRALYLPEELSRRTSSPADPKNASSIDYRFATELFWIVSRVNNCHYCLGHQEDKLLQAGMSESELLLLDTDWSDFKPKQQAALEFAKKLTHQPHLIDRSDIEAMLAHYSTSEILEIAFLIGRYNATNRWTDSLGIPQESHRQFTTKLDPTGLNSSSVVTVEAKSDRPPATDFHQWQQQLMEANMGSTLQKFNGNAAGSLSASMEQLLIKIPPAGRDWAAQVKDAQRVGLLDPVLKAKIAFVAAHADHAWEMQRWALDRLANSGVNHETAFALRVDLDKRSRTEPTAAALEFALKLTSQPQNMTDQDILKLEQHFDAQEIAEIVYHTGLAAMLNRLTRVASIVLIDQ